MSENSTAINSQPNGKKSAWRWSQRQARLTGYLLGFLLVVILAGGGIWAAQNWKGSILPALNSLLGKSSTSGQWQRPVVSKEEFERLTGVRIVQLAITGGGGLIDLRYQVVDPTKADVIHSSVSAIIDQATGVVVSETLMGHVHSGVYKTGETYYSIYENPGNLVQRGSKVNVLLGDVEMDDWVMH